MTKEEMTKEYRGYRKSLRQMTDDLYHRQLESIKLESMATIDLVDMLRDRDERIKKLESENGKLKGELTKVKQLLAFWVDDFYDSFNNTIKYEERHKALVEAEQFLKEVDK